MASDARPVQDRLDFKIECKRPYSSFRRREFMRLALRSHHTFRYRDLILILMATYA